MNRIVHENLEPKAYTVDIHTTLGANDDRYRIDKLHIAALQDVSLEDGHPSVVGAAIHLFRRAASPKDARR